MTRTQALVLTLVAAGALAACSKSDSDAKKPAEPTEPATKLAPAAKPAPTVSFDEALSSYEAIRAALVQDKTDGVADAAAKIAEVATKIAEVATKASEAAPDAAKPHYAALSKAAGELGKAGDLAAMRGAFGEVSRHMVGLMEMSPDLAKGQHVFECPMAKGYKRWVQPSAELANPYMGTEMLTCGSEVAFGEHDMKGMDPDKMKGMDPGKMKGMDHGSGN